MPPPEPEATLDAELTIRRFPVADERTNEKEPAPSNALIPAPSPSPTPEPACARRIPDVTVVSDTDRGPEARMPAPSARAVSPPLILIADPEKRDDCTENPLVSKMERAPPAPSARPKDDAVMAFAAKVELDTVPESTTALTAPPTPPASTEVPVPFAYIAFPVKVDDRIEMESLIEPSFT